MSTALAPRYTAEELSQMTETHEVHPREKRPVSEDLTWYDFTSPGTGQLLELREITFPSGGATQND